MTHYRRLPPDHGLRRPRYLSTEQAPSAAKDRMDQLPGRRDHCAAVRHYRHHRCLFHRCLLHPNRLRCLIFTLCLPPFPLPPLHLLSVPQLKRVMWRLQVLQKHNMSTLITHWTPRTARWLCLPWERYRSSSPRRCGSNTSTLAPPCLILHHPVSTATGTSV